MGRTRKKPRKGEKRKNSCPTNPRRLLFLLQHPLNELPANQLSSTGDILRYIQFLKSPRSTKYGSTKILVACPQLKNTRDLICKDGSCTNQDQRCVTSAVIDVWKKAGFEDYIVSGSAVRDKMLKLHQKYSNLTKLKSLNWNSSLGNFTKIQEEFIEESNKLFDISVPKFEEKIRSDRLRSQEAKDEDIQFFLDQKGERNMYISSELDKAFESSVKNKENRHRRMEEAKVKEQEDDGDGSRNELEVSFDSSAGTGSEGTIASTDDEDSADESLRHSRPSKAKIMISISPDDLVDCTAAVSARYRLGIRPHTSLVAAICNKAGVNLEDITLSRATVHRKRFKKIEELGDKIRQDIMTTLKGKKLCLHFDGKQVKQIEEDLNITVTVERIAISVTSPDLDDTDDILLGVVQASSSKGCDQADVILNLLEYYDIVDQIFAVCCDTTSSNTGVFSGAIVLLSTILDTPLLWFLCRRHMLEVHISHFMEALTGEKTKAPRRGLYVKLQKVWPSVKEDIDKMEGLIKFNWKTLQVGSPLYELAKEALQFGERALTLETFARGDYRKLCEMFVFYLGGEVPGFHFHQPGACHEARFMADALYILTLRMTQNVTKVMNEEEKTMLETAAFFISICYAPWFLKSYMVVKAPSNDLAAFKSAFHIEVQYPKLGKALLASMQRHSWYLSEQLVLLALADDDIEQELKSKILERLLDSEVPDQFRMGKPELPVILMSTELSELVGPQSWFLVKVADVPKEELEKWKRGEATQSFDTFKNFVKKIACVNDCAERNIRLIQDFIGGYKSEDMKQNLMLVARDNRKKLKKELSKTQLKDV